MLNNYRWSRFPAQAGYILSLAFVVAITTGGTDLMASERHLPAGTVAGNAHLPKPQTAPSIVNIPLSALVGPGDVLVIKAYPDTAAFISGAYTIFDSGFVMLPILGRVQATNSSIAELNRYLTESYAKYTAYPDVQVEPQIHLLMLGGFLRPGVYLVNPLLPFSNALGIAGGTVRDDGLRLLRWERNGRVLSKDLTAAVEGRMSLWASGFKSGDQVCITLNTKKDILPVVSFFSSTAIAAGTLIITLMLLLE